MAQFFADDGESIILTDEQSDSLLLYGALTDEQKKIVKDTMRNFGK